MWSSLNVKCRSLGLKTVKTTCKIPRLNSYLIVGAWLLVVRKRRQLVADQSLLGGVCLRHTFWNPSKLIADTGSNINSLKRGQVIA